MAVSRRPSRRSAHDWSTWATRSGSTAEIEGNPREFLTGSGDGDHENEQPFGYVSDPDKPLLAHVFKVTTVFERYRPDLTTVLLDTEPTGLLVVLGLDPESTVLADHYDEIVAEYATDDPQSVPDEVLNRWAAADPQLIADSPVWGELATAREADGPIAPVETMRSLRGTAQSQLRAGDFDSEMRAAGS